jgi:hypothetical protein
MDAEVECLKVPQRRAARACILVILFVERQELVEAWMEQLIKSFQTQIDNLTGSVIQVRKDTVQITKESAQALASLDMSFREPGDK